ncbi:MAG: DinB family protein [Chloroflexi bacterium]|nr:DinB family protein [Chloroflexota bacterium]
MNFPKAVQHLKDNSKIIRLLVEDLDDKTARQKPDPESWSILEVINHLADEEREDFRAHLEQMLHHPDEPWTPIDPQGWVTQREYNGRSLSPSLADFLQERQNSLVWLAALGAPNWNTFREAPWGQFTAGDLLAAWVAHDILHIRQLVELKWAYTVADLRPYNPQYAGEW